MKALVLTYNYSDNSGFGIVRVYKKEDEAHAEKDLELFREHASDCKNYDLIESDFFNR